MWGRAVQLLVVSVVAVGGALSLEASTPPVASAAVCADHPDQASAQRAKDTRDADGDGIYCESLPCPCRTTSDSAPPSEPRAKTRPARSTTKARTKANSDCTRSARVVPISFSRTRFPTIRKHTETAIAAGWPSVLRVNRVGSDARRRRLLAAGFPARPGFDRDEYPPAVGRGRGPGLERGTDPRGWRASLAYVPASENRSHGSNLGIKLRRYCDGQRFRYVFF